MTAAAQDSGAGRLFHRIDGEGPPVVFIQGVGVHHTGWRLQVEALAPRFRCLVFDNRGIGRSPAVSGPFTVEDMVGDLLGLLEIEGWQRVHLVGHSLGGLVALRLAQMRPDRVLSLALLCTFARGRNVGATSRMAWLGLRSRLGTRRMRRNAFLEILAPSALLAGVDREELAARLAPFFGHDLADHEPVEMRQLSALRRCDATPGLARLTGIPTLVVGAQQDPIATPALVEELAAGIPGARLEWLSDASHGVIVHQPERINPLLLEHLLHAGTVRDSQRYETRDTPWPN